jgi:tight adherence protein B
MAASAGAPGLLVATLAGLGMALLAFGVWRAGRRTTTSRRIATLLAIDEALPGPAASPIVAPPRWRLELTQVLAAVQARGTTLRGPVMITACGAALIGVSTLAPFWLALAAATGLAAYWLGGQARRRQQIESQALDTMQLLSSGLRAGYSVSQAIQLVVRHSPEPTRSEFAIAAQEIGIGVQLEDAIARLAARTANADYVLVSIILGVQHEVGGNLAQILDSVGSTLRERFELRRQVNALTAQQRLSSIILTALPFGLLAILFAMDRSFVEPLFTELAGRVLLVLACAMVLIGWTIMRSMGRVEV